MSFGLGRLRKVWPVSYPPSLPRPANSGMDALDLRLLTERALLTRHPPVLGTSYRPGPARSGSVRLGSVRSGLPPNPACRGAMGQTRHPRLRIPVCLRPRHDPAPPSRHLITQHRRPGKPGTAPATRLSSAQPRPPSHRPAISRRRQRRAGLAKARLVRFSGNEHSSQRCVSEPDNLVRPRGGVTIYAVVPLPQVRE